MASRLNILGIALIASTAASAAMAGGAADFNGNSGGFNTGWNMTAGQENQMVDPSMRDANNNMTIVNGVIAGSAYSVQDNAHQASVGSANTQATATAIGNSLNVVVNGSWNTTVVNSNQINNGNQTATLNGALKL